MAISTVVKQLVFRSSIVFLIKIIGAAVRIPLFRLLGAEGVGLYQMFYSVYGLVLTFVTGGIPMALSLTTAKNKMQGLRMLKASVLLLAVMGAILGVLFHILASDIAAMLGDARLEWALRLVAPAVCIVPLLSLLRGFLQGIEYYGVIAVSELIEQVFRVLTMLILVALWIQHGVGMAVGGTAFGAVAGAIIALIFLIIVLIIFLRTMHSTFLTANELVQIKQLSFKFFLRTSLAITASRFIIPLADLIDALIIPHRLQHVGLTNDSAIALYGIFSGMAVSIVFLPTLISSAVSHIFAAKMAMDWKQGYTERFHRRCLIILKSGWLWGLGCSIYFFWYHAELSQLLFGNQLASLAIMYMSFAPLFSGLRDLSTTILWAEEKNKSPMVGLLLGVMVASGLGYFFVGLPGFSHKGIAMELLSLEIVAAIWNIGILHKRHKRLFSLAWIFLESTLLIVIAVLFFYISANLVSDLQLPVQQKMGFELVLSFLGLSGFILLRSFMLSK